MLHRAKYLLKIFALTVLLFAVGKVAFMLVNMGNQPFSFADVLAVLYQGLSLDLSTALYFVSVPFLLVAASVWLTIPRRLWKLYYMVVAVVYAFVMVADCSFYPFLNFKLNASSLQYLASPAEATAGITWGYLLLRLAVFVVAALLVFWLYYRVDNRFQPVTRRWVATGCSLVTIPLMVVGMRGGLDVSTTNIGQVYFSQNQFLNHSAVNPVFSFFASFEKSANDIMPHDYFSQAECNRLMQGLYNTQSVGSDTLLTMSRPDIVIIILKNAGEVVGDAMPRLQQLKQEGINFTACYANSWRADRGTVSIWSGYPSFPSTSVMKMPDKTLRLPSIARTLQDAGYYNSYYFGGDINFKNMRSYVVGTGFRQLNWKKSFTLEEQRTCQRGVRDDIMFDAVYQQLASGDGKHPQLVGFSTLSTRDPWDVPFKKLHDPVKNAFYYLDDCIGNFIDRLKQSPLWQKTLVILIPDHSIDYGGINETSRSRNLIPMVWLGGAVREPRQFDMLCNQSDLAATLLGQLGLPHDDFLWSRDVLSDSYRYPFAVHNYDNGYSLLDSSGFMLYDIDAHKLVVNQSLEVNRLKRMGDAILQSTTKDLKELDMR